MSAPDTTYRAVEVRYGERIQRFASGDPVADMQAAWVWLRTLGPVEVMYSSSVDDFVADSAIWTYESDGRLLRRMTPRAQAEKALALAEDSRP